MEQANLAEILGTALAGALEKRGYSALTPVQAAVLAPSLQGRDLRISSQTGSGKTLAVGFAVRDLVDRKPLDEKPGAGPRPCVLFIVPTRELAKQVRDELGWLFEPLGARVVAVSGGANYRDEQRALAMGPAVVVGTPGRLLDQLSRGAFDASGIEALVLDEADRMLDMGFREEIEAILEGLPTERRTHLVSATFPRQVEALADGVQRDPVRVQGTPHGSANLDIDHVVHLVDPAQRVDAVVNLILANAGERVLVFARTRADVAALTEELARAQFRVSALSGELEQRDRERALSAFKRGALDALIATDVAARGIDVTDIGRVIHVEPPEDVDTYTHRSGRTGRAGRKGTSSVLTTQGELWRTMRLLARARVKARFEPVPTARAIRDADDERWFRELTEDQHEGSSPAPDPATMAGSESPPAVDRAQGRDGRKGGSSRGDRLEHLADRLAQSPHAKTAILRLLSKVNATTGRQPREVRLIEPPPPEAPRRPHAKGRPVRAPLIDARQTARGRQPSHTRPMPRDLERTRAERQTSPAWVPFVVTWGEVHGADARRLLALICRRGGIRGDEVGAIRVGRTKSVVEIDGGVADTFASAATAPDPRDPRVRILAEELPYPVTPSSPANPPSRPHRARLRTEHSSPTSHVPHAAAPRDRKHHGPGPSAGRRSGKSKRRG